MTDLAAIPVPEAVAAIAEDVERLVTAQTAWLRLDRHRQSRESDEMARRITALHRRLFVDVFRVPYERSVAVARGQVEAFDRANSIWRAAFKAGNDAGARLAAGMAEERRTLIEGHEAELLGMASDGEG